jgi:hypothetical protein
MSRPSRSRRFVPSLESMPLRLTPSSVVAAPIAATVPPPTAFDGPGSGMAGNGTGGITQQGTSGNP